jgi:hypothetical protein
VNAINVLIPALAGVFGIALGALLAGRNQRNQIHIERMIAAADEFSTRATAALAALYTAVSRPEASGKLMAQVEELIPDVRARLPRVVLLFHPDSDTTKAAREAAAQLWVAEYEFSLYSNLDDVRQPGPVFHRMWRRCDEANGALENFLREATQSIRKPGRRRFGPLRDFGVEIAPPESSESRQTLDAAAD